MAGRKLQGIRLSEAAVLYFEYMEDCNLKPNTVATAKSTLRGFEHVIGNKVVRNVDWQDVTRYFGVRGREGGQLPTLCPATINLQMHRLKMFFQWAVRFHYMDSATDPMHGRKKIKIVPAKRARLEAHEFADVLDAAANPRDRMVIALGLYTLMRAGEIRALLIGDLAMSDLALQMVRYKTGERDELAICAELQAELASYLMWYSQHVGRPLENDWYLVPTNERRKPSLDAATRQFVPASLDQLVLVPTKPLYPQASAWIVQRALRTIGWDVTAKEGGHTLRRSAAREMFEALRETGFDDAIMTVMSWLGHKQPLVTMRYLGLEREAERRNKRYKGQVMYPRAVRQNVSNVVPLRAVGGADD